MKNTDHAIGMLIFAIVLSLQSSAFDPLPSGCVDHCSRAADCMVCISACEGYISNYADINAVRNSILSRQAVNTSGYNALAVYNLERCWCSACCDYKYGGDSVHPCIYPCPCTIKNITNNATTTTILDKNKRPELNSSLSEINDSVNYSLCYLLNILWIVIPGISALIIMWAGSRYMASEEDPAKRASARGIMIYAISGLVFSLVACPAVDYLIVNTNITPFTSSCKCYELMALKPGVPPTLPFIANVTTQPFVQTTHGAPTTIVRHGTTTTRSATTTSTTLECLGPCAEYKRTKVLPAAFDWRNVNGKNYMTPVKDQGLCGSCWTFSTIGSIEGVYNVEQCKPSNTDLSEQELVSCDHTPGDTGCDGGFPSKAHSYIKTNGECIETCFPYKSSNGVTGTCNICQSPALWRTTSIITASAAASDIKAKLICTGPLSVCGWSKYYSQDGQWHPEHAITLAGWDDNSSICRTHYSTPGCWIIKNSWGVHTGVLQPGNYYHEAGYAYIPYNSDGGNDITSKTVPPVASIGIKAP